MSQLDSAKAVAEAYISEIVATLEIRESYNDIIVAQATSLFSAFATNAHVKRALQRALKHKAVDASAFYRPMIVQANGVFENYVRSLVKAIIEDRYEANFGDYFSLEVTFRNNHIFRAARLLAHIKTGHVGGIAYNFDTLVKSLGINFSNQPGIKLHHDIYTILMGNCTPERLEILFAELGLPEPFSPEIGKNVKLSKFFNERSPKRVAEATRKRLQDAIDFRNDIAHGNLTRSVSSSDLSSCIEFFSALIDGLDGLVR